MNASSVRRPFAVLAPLALIAVLASGCSEDPPVSAAGDDEGAVTEAGASESIEVEIGEAAELPSEDDLQKYFDAAASYDVSQLEDARGLAEPGSIAEAYVGYLAASMTAYVDGGTPTFEGTTAERDGDGYEFCPDPTDDATCLLFSDIEGRDGKIVSFTVNGEALNERLSVGSKKAVRAGTLGSARLLYAYQSVQSGALFVIVEVRSGPKPVTVASYEATYRSPEGRQSKASEFQGPTDLGADSTANISLAFAGAKPGGAATLKFLSDDFMSEQVVELKTR